MTDRIPTHPGRVSLVPVPGETNKYDMTMADEPVDAGTPLNKANLLTDATAAAIGAAYGSTPSTPNEALALLAGGVKIETFSFTGDGTYGVGHETVLAFSHEPVLFVVASRQSYQVDPFYNTTWLSWEAIKDAWANKGGLSYAAIKVAYNGSNYDLRFTLSDTTLSVWSTQSSGAQWNDSTANDNEYYVVSFYV